MKIVEEIHHWQGRDGVNRKLVSCVDNILKVQYFKDGQWHFESYHTQEILREMLTLKKEVMGLKGEGDKIKTIIPEENLS
jgi:hypothetical protein